MNEFNRVETIEGVEFMYTMYSYPNGENVKEYYPENPVLTSDNKVLEIRNGGHCGDPLAYTRARVVVSKFPTRKEALAYWLTLEFPRHKRVIRNHRRILFRDRCGRGRALMKEILDKLPTNILSYDKIMDELRYMSEIYLSEIADSDTAIKISESVLWSRCKIKISLGYYLR